MATYDKQSGDVKQPKQGFNMNQSNRAGRTTLIEYTCWQLVHGENDFLKPHGFSSVVFLGSSH